MVRANVACEMIVMEGETNNAANREVILWMKKSYFGQKCKTDFMVAEGDETPSFYRTLLGKNWLRLSIAADPVAHGTFALMHRR